MSQRWKRWVGWWLSFGGVFGVARAVLDTATAHSGAGMLGLSAIAIYAGMTAGGVYWIVTNPPEHLAWWQRALLAVRYTFSSPRDVGSSTHEESRWR